MSGRSSQLGAQRSRSSVEARSWRTGSAGRRQAGLQRQSPYAERRHLQLEIERDVEAPGIARAAATGLCQQAGIDQTSCFTVVLLVSEVVTNAVLHSKAPAGSTIGLSIAVGDGMARVTVTDAGEGFTPKRRDPSSREDGGYGLYLLEKSASRWGVSTLNGTCVWFEVAFSGEASGAPTRPA